MEVGEEPPLGGVDEVLHLGLQPEPLEVDRHLLVRRHHRLHALLKIFKQ